MGGEDQEPGGARPPLSIDGDGVERGGSDDLLVSEVGGLVALVGSDAAIERFLATEPALAHSRPVDAGDVAVVGSIVAGVEAVQVAPRLFELDAVGRAMFQSGLLAKAKGAAGWYRGWGRDGSQIVRQAMLRPAALTPQQLLSLQLGVATMGLAKAIKEVQRSVERVDRHVQALSDLVASMLVGEVIGANRVLSRRVDAFHEHGTIADADWAAVEGLGAQAEQHVEQLRAFLRKRMPSAAGGGAKEREQALDDIVAAAFVLPLLLVAQANIFRFQVLRLHRIAAHEPAHLEAALEEGRALLDGQWAEDATLAGQLRSAGERHAGLAALDIVHWDAAHSIPRLVADVNEDLAAFTHARSLPFEPIPLPPVPSPAEAFGELRSRATEVTDRARFRLDVERTRRKHEQDEAEKALPPPPPF